MVYTESLNVIEISEAHLREFRSGRSPMKILTDPATHKMSISLKKVDRRETRLSKQLIGAKLQFQNEMIGTNLQSQKSPSRSQF
jgi:hypothetical protein